MAVIEPKTVLLKNGKEVCIRTANGSDTMKAIDYLKVLFADDRFFLTTAEEAKEWQKPEKEQERLEECFQDDNKLFAVTVAGDKIVSMSHIDCGTKQRTVHVADMGISILAEYRGIGLGTAIMQAMIDWATAHPVIEKLALGVWAANERAIRLYEKMGFVEEGRKIKEIKYADGAYDDCILMYRFVGQA